MPDTLPDKLMPTEIDGKRVASAYRNLPSYGGLYYSFTVIIDQDYRSEGLNRFTFAHLTYSIVHDRYEVSSERVNLTWTQATRLFGQHVTRQFPQEQESTP